MGNYHRLRDMPGLDELVQHRALVAKVVALIIGGGIALGLLSHIAVLVFLRWVLPS